MNNQRILVVDDLEEVRSSVAHALRDEGYEADMAPDAASALRHLKDWPAALVLTDYRMPGMDGIELIQHIRESQPEQSVLLMTGYNGTWDAPDFNVAECIRKPIDVEDLVWKIDCALACRSQAEEARTSGDADVKIDVAAEVDLEVDLEIEFDVDNGVNSDGRV